MSVADVNRALAFYTNKVRFTLDVDYWPAPGFRVVQLTPPGSATSIQIGLGITTASQGSAQGLYLVAADLETTHRELTERRVTVGAIRHKAPVEDWRGDLEPGLDPDRRDYASFADFSDPDGNAWVLQERGYQATR